VQNASAIRERDTHHWKRCRPVTLGLLFLALATTGAARTPNPVTTPPTLRHTPLRRGRHGDQTWAGYAVINASPYSAIKGSWIVPAMDCTRAGGDASPWVGIDGWSNDTVEQIGVDLDCYRGRASYHPWVEMYPGPSDYFREPIRAGDTLTASVTVSGDTWRLTESDTRTGWTRTFYRDPKNPPKESSAEAIVEDVGKGAVPPVPDFHSVSFTGITVNGKTFASAGRVQRTTLERGSTPLSSETPLSGGHFSVDWKHS
jgi:Peptidase A4 family